MYFIITALTNQSITSQSMCHFGRNHANLHWKSHVILRLSHPDTSEPRTGLQLITKKKKKSIIDVYILRKGSLTLLGMRFPSPSPYPCSLTVALKKVCFLWVWFCFFFVSALAHSFSVQGLWPHSKSQLCAAGLDRQSQWD